MDAKCAHLGADLPATAGSSASASNASIIIGNTALTVVAGGYRPKRRFPALRRSERIRSSSGMAWCFSSTGRRAISAAVFDNCRPEDFVRGKPFRFVAECAWYMLGANAFDEQHFLAVHDRRLIDRPRVDGPTPFAHRIQYQVDVVGTSIFDRLLRAFNGPVVDVSISDWGGTLVLATGFFRRVRSYVMLVSRPIAEHQTMVDVIVFARRSRLPYLQGLVDPISLRVRRRFTQAFLQDDRDRLGGIRYNPRSLLPSDQLLNGFFNWAANLPAHARTTSYARAGANRCGRPSLNQ